MLMAPRGQTNYGNCHMQEFFSPLNSLKKKSPKQGKNVRIDQDQCQLTEIKKKNLN